MSSLRRSSWTCTITLSLAASVQAQGSPSPVQKTPERKTSTDPASTRGSGPWSMTVNVFDGYDHTRYDSPAPTADDPAATGPTRSGQQPGFALRFDSHRSRDRSTVALGGGLKTAYYSFARKVLTDVNVTASQSVTIGRRRTTVGATENLSYAPYYSLGLLSSPQNGLGDTGVNTAGAPAPDLALDTSPVGRYGVSGQLSQPLSSRTDVNLTYGVYLTRTDTDVVSTTSQNAGLQLRHRATRGLGFHARYATTHTTYAGDRDSSQFHSVEVGTDLTKTSSPTRRTTLRFTGGSTIAEPQRGAGAPTPLNRETRLLAGASLDHYFGRTWSTRASYRRDWQQLEGTTTPFFRNSLTATAGGGLNRWTLASATVAYLTGESRGADTEAEDHAYTASAWVQFVFSRSMSLFTQYAYNRQRFDVLSNELNLPSQIERSSVRVGLVLLLPPAR